MPSPAGDNISVRLRDYKGVNTVATAYATFGAGDTVAGISAAIQTWMNLLNNVTGAKIVQSRYELLVAPTGAAAARTAGQAGVNAEVGLLLEFPKPTADSPPWSFHIPAVQPGLILAGSPDMTEGATIDLLADVMENVNGTTPISGTTGGFFTSAAGAVLIPVADGRISTHKHRKSSGKRATGA